MHIPDLANTDALLKRGRESILYRERKVRLEKVRGLMSKWLDLAPSGTPVADVAEKITKYMEEIESLNKMIAEK